MGRAAHRDEREDGDDQRHHHRHRHHHHRSHRGESDIHRSESGTHLKVEGFGDGRRPSSRDRAMPSTGATSTPRSRSAEESYRGSAPRRSDDGPASDPMDQENVITVHEEESSSEDQGSPEPKHHGRSSEESADRDDRNPRQSRHHAKDSRHKGHRHHGNIIESSRPPVSSSKRPSKRTYQTKEMVYSDSKPRRSSSVGSVRSHSSRRPSSILGGIFSNGAGLTTQRASPEKPTPRVECVVCMSDVKETKVARLKCGHNMCNSCLQRSFKLSVTDPQHMPPRCCTEDHIPLEHVNQLFDTKFKKTWNRKFAEYSTRDRMYCPNRKCGEWIKPSNIRREQGKKVGRCGRCRTKVCGLCNGKYHKGLECPKDEATNQFLDHAKGQGWQRCYRCKAMVELERGCNHMTCRCKAEFCMVCGVKWKQCDCPWFNYNENENDDADDLAYGQVPFGMRMPPARGDIGDIFHDGNGPPMPRELRESMSGRRPQGFREEMRMRRDQEHQDEEIARRMQMFENVHPHDFRDVSGGRTRDGSPSDDGRWGPGEPIVGIGNAAGHFMNDSYRRQHGSFGGSFMDRRGDRMAEVRRRAAMFSRHVDMGPHRLLNQGLSPQWDANGSPITPYPRVRHHGRTPSAPLYTTELPHRRVPPSVDGAGEVYDMSGAPGMTSTADSTPRQYADDTNVHGSKPRRSKSTKHRHTHSEQPPDSTLAGLTGRGRGQNRVSQWRNFVAPGDPERDAVPPLGS